jgi:hypothetical protein
MQCPTCASPLPVGAMICGECGRTLSGVDTSAPETPRPVPTAAPEPPAWRPRAEAPSAPDRPWWVRDAAVEPATDGATADADAVSVSGPDGPPAWRGDTAAVAPEESTRTTGRADAPVDVTPAPDPSAARGDAEVATATIAESSERRDDAPKPTPAPLREPSPARENGRRPSSAPLWTASLTPITPADLSDGDDSSGVRPAVSADDGGGRTGADDSAEAEAEADEVETDDTETDDTETDGSSTGEREPGGTAGVGSAHDASGAVVPAPGPGDTVRVEPIRDSTERRDESEEALVPLVEPGTADQAERCTQCGAEVHEDDIFCGVCGAVVQSVALSFTGPIVPLLRRQGNDHVPSAEDDVVARDRKPSSLSGDSPTSLEPSTAAEPPLEAPLNETPAGPDPDPDLAPAPSAPPELPPLPEPAWLPRATPTPTPTPSTVDEEEDVDETRIVRRGAAGSPFVLQFSTGESFTVDGTGLVGRAPTPQPGERFDQLIRIVDPGRSVSKTHLEFGQEDGHLWLSDRWSGNGTIVRPRDQRARRLEPGARVRVARGSRVDIGEQFFVVG